MLKVLFPWKQNNTKKVLAAMEQVVNEETTAEELPPDELPLLPCHVCSRTFLPRPLKKHIPICEQTARKKRKPFDSLKQRVEGTDMAPFYQKSYLKKGNPEMGSQAQAGDVYCNNNKQSKWREKHFELQTTIKNAKGTKTEMTTNHSNNLSTTPYRKASHLNVNQNSSNERCPVCDRSFGPKAFDRHVEFCKEQRNRVQVHKSPAVVQQAKERLEARINYRVPPLRQSKRSLVRDKYSPSSQTNILSRSNSIVSGKSTTSISSAVTTMLPNRRQISNINDKSVERNHKKEVGSKTRVDRTMGDCADSRELTKNENSKSIIQTTNNTNYDPFEKAHLQLMELIEDDNNSITSSNTISAMSTPTIDFRPFHTAISTPKQLPETINEHSDRKRASVIDPPYHFQDNRASRDLDKEFELLESLMNNNLDDTSDRPLSESEKIAFKSKDFSDEVDLIDPKLINAQDNLFIPEHLPSDEQSPNSNLTYDGSAKRVRESKQTTQGSRMSRRPNRLGIKTTTRPLPLIRPDLVRLAPDGSSAESQTNEGRRASPKANQMSRLKSKIRIDFSPDAQKNKNNRRFGTSNMGKQTGMEFGKTAAEGLEDVSSKEEPYILNRTPTAEELYPDNPMMYEEFRKYEELYRREKEGRSGSSKKQRKKTADFGINIEDTSKTYEDSAYGSLNRKQQIEDHEISEQVEKFVVPAHPTTAAPVEKLPKYCHECGNKYPVNTAKFCVECGVKRLIL